MIRLPPFAGIVTEADARNGGARGAGRDGDPVPQTHIKDWRPE